MRWWRGTSPCIAAADPRGKTAAEWESIVLGQMGQYDRAPVRMDSPGFVGSENVGKGDPMAFRRKA